MIEPAAAGVPSATHRSPPLPERNNCARLIAYSTGALVDADIAVTYADAGRPLVMRCHEAPLLVLRNRLPPPFAHKVPGPAS